jgi:hypothetical protein
MTACQGVHVTQEYSPQQCTVRDAAEVGDVPGGAQKGATGPGSGQPRRWRAAGDEGGADGAAGRELRRAGGAVGVLPRG